METQSYQQRRCHDCGKKMLISDKGVVENGYLLEYERSEYDKIKIFKCEDCYKKDKSYSQQCEVYSRIVGYLRPTSSWNAGKQQEFKERKTFTK